MRCHRGRTEGSSYGCWMRGLVVLRDVVSHMDDPETRRQYQWEESGDKTVSCLERGRLDVTHRDYLGVCLVNRAKLRLVRSRGTWTVSSLCLSWPSERAGARCLLACCMCFSPVVRVFDSFLLWDSMTASRLDNVAKHCAHPHTFAGSMAQTCACSCGASAATSTLDVSPTYRRYSCGAGHMTTQTLEGFVVNSWRAFHINANRSGNARCSCVKAHFFPKLRSQPQKDLLA